MKLLPAAQRGSRMRDGARLMVRGTPRSLLTLLVFMIGVSGAEATQVTGSIAVVDSLGQQIMLWNGKIFKLPKTLRARGLKLGEKVTVNYTRSGYTNRASSIVAVR